MCETNHIQVRKAKESERIELLNHYADSGDDVATLIHKVFLAHEGDPVFGRKCRESLFAYKKISRLPQSVLLKEVREDAESSLDGSDRFNFPSELIILNQKWKLCERIH